MVCGEPTGYQDMPLKNINHKIVWLILAAACGVLLVYGLPNVAERQMNLTAAHQPYQPSPAAIKLHNSLFVADLHSDSLLWNRNLLRRASRGHVDIPRLQEGNVALQVFTAVTKSPRGQNNDRNSADSDNITLLAIAQLWPPRTWFSLFERAAYQAEKLAAFSADSDGELRFVKTRTDLQEVIEARAHGEPIIAAIYGIEGAHPLEGDLANLDRLFDMGLRQLGLTHFFDNALGGSLHGESGAGLTDFGRQVIARANELEMIVDVAHSAPQVVRDVLAMSGRPVILSHGGIKSACPSPRNLDDELMKALAEHGGLLGVGFWDSAVCDFSPDGIAATMRRAVEIMGIDHVAMGSDYDGSVEVAMTSNELVALTDALRRVDFSDEDIAQIMGGNTRDFFLHYLPVGK
ncbi:MAG: membrane dipeptidase [Halieaceae bacterium]|jgi:membrane dipeptidase